MSVILTRMPLVNEVAKYMGTLPQHGAIPLGSNRPDPEFPQGKILELTVDTALEKALVQVCFPTDDFWDIGKTRRLNILADIFSERLRKDIREKLGASYSPYAYIMTPPTNMTAMVFYEPSLVWHPIKPKW